EREAARAQAARCAAEHEKVTAELERARRQSSEQEAEIGRAEANTREAAFRMLEKACLVMQDTAVGSAQDQEDLARQVAAAEMQAQEARAAFGSVQGDLDAARAHGHEVTAKLRAMETRAEEAEELASQAEAKRQIECIATREGVVHAANLRNRLAEAESRLCTTEATLEDQKQQLVKMKSIASAQSASKAEVENKLAELLGEKAKLQDEIQVVSARCSSRQDKLNEARSKILQFEEIAATNIQKAEAEVDELTLEADNALTLIAKAVRELKMIPDVFTAYPHLEPVYKNLMGHVTKYSNDDDEQAEHSPV
ncbi:hypothetical protein CYMTET_23297, partial [Cymbomonas tetramitiformis]